MKMVLTVIGLIMLVAVGMMIAEMYNRRAWSCYYKGRRDEREDAGRRSTTR
jgi:hypothetical protein